MDKEKQELIDRILMLYDELMELRKSKQEITPASLSTQDTPCTS